MARIIVLGLSGNGKSWYSGKLIEDVVPFFDGAIHFDIEDEEKGFSQGEDPLYATIRIGQEAYESGVDIVQLVEKFARIRIVPEGLMEDEHYDLYGQCCKAAMDIATSTDQTIFVSCDEAHQATNKGDLDNRVNRLVTGGRKHGAETMHISQRAQQLDTTIVSQADKGVYFGMNEENDVKKLQNSTMFNAERLAELDPREAIIENRNSGDHALINTNDMERKTPHGAGDDGIADEGLPI